MKFEDINETLSLLDDWEDRYAYLRDLGDKLPAYPPERMDAAHSVPGCLSQVWMDYTWVDNKLDMRLMSDSVFVKGLLAVLISLYQGKTPQEILTIDAKAAFASLGLDNKLTMNRRDGFVAVASRITALARAAAPQPE